MPNSKASQPEGQRLFSQLRPWPVPSSSPADRRYPPSTWAFRTSSRRRIRAGLWAQTRRRQGSGADRHSPAQRSTPPIPGPETAIPIAASFVSDNDLGRWAKIVAFLVEDLHLEGTSAFFVTEDDAQSGVDHVDAHRSILLVASPWVRPGAVSHQHTSMGPPSRAPSMNCSGLGPMNLEDALGRKKSPASLRISPTRPIHTCSPCRASIRPARLFPAKARFRQTEDKGRGHRPAWTSTTPTDIRGPDREIVPQAAQAERRRLTNQSRRQEPGSTFSSRNNQKF